MRISRSFLWRAVFGKGRGAGLNSLLLTSAILVPIPLQAIAQQETLDVRVVCHPLEIHQNGPDEKSCLTQFADVAKREGHSLSLKLKNGKTKVLSDAKECDDPDKEGDCYTYRLVGYIEDRQFIVSVAPYECGYNLMVDRRTGKETKLGGWPVLSPNRKRFVVTDTFATGECTADYNIAIFSLASDPPRLEWYYTADTDHEDYFIDGWDGENRVLMQGNGNGKDHPSDLKHTAQGWQLRLPNGQLSSGVSVSPAQANDPKSAFQPANPVAPPSR
jgi:hypothetical protein